MASAQATDGPPVDYLVVEGNQRVSGDQIIQSSGLVLFQPVNYRGVQRAIQALFATGKFDDVRVEQRGGEEKLIIAIIVKERPILQRWTVRGTDQVSEGAVRGKVGAHRGPPHRSRRRGEGPGLASTRSTRSGITTPRR